MLVGVGAGIGDVEFVCLSSSLTLCVLKRAWLWGAVEKTIHDLVHHGGLARLTALLQGLELKAVDEGCGAGGP